MKIIRSIKEMSLAAGRLKRAGKRIGFVPTMGALHAGHASLIARARRENDAVVVSIFVNPIQFGPQEDFKRYPRNLSRDAALCRALGADILFFPSAGSMYAKDFKTYVRVEGLSDVLCGSFRPGHFRGVATVVAKLFNIVRPDTAYFGKKDAQQARIIQKMVEDLNFPLRVRVLPTVREKDGLAMSSRNAYLRGSQRRDALAVPQALSLAKEKVRSGLRDAAAVIRLMRRHIERVKGVRIDYVAIVDQKNLMPVKKIGRGSLAALAVRIGRTRLIDNVALR